MTKERKVTGVNLDIKNFRKLELMEQQSGLSRSEIIRRLIESAYIQPAVITATEAITTKED